MIENDPVERAREHVTRVRDFFYHLATFLLVSLILVIVDRRGGEGSEAFLGLDWAYWVIVFWGFGVACQAVWAYFDDHRADRLAARTTKV